MGDRRRIRLSEIKRALRHGGRIDGSALVLGGRTDAASPKLVFSDEEHGAHRPPILMSSYDHPGRGSIPEDEDSWALRRMSTRQFEALSLAARAVLLHRTSAREEKRADAPIGQRAGMNLDGFPLIHAEDVLEALAWASEKLGQGQDGLAQSAEQLAMRGGLQIIGCEITARKSRDGLRLVNARLPISVRLVGCVVNCPVLLAHCELVSLDLSGSALEALDATGLTASGSVYMRRTLVQSPVNFSSARIAGGFLASEAVIMPRTRQPTQLARDPDHGVLNLSRATIENEFRLSRARIWGGLSLRGARIGRSAYISEAVIASPLGLIQKWVGDRMPPPRSDLDPWTTQRLAHADMTLAKNLHRKSPKDPLCETQDDSLESMEVYDPGSGVMMPMIDRSLMKLRPRALLAAIRADGLCIDGTLFARGIVCIGQFRMKYAEISQSLRLEGALLVAAETIFQSVFDDTPWPQKEDFKEFWDKIIQSLHPPYRVREASDVALDLRETRVAGDLSLGRGRPVEGGRDKSARGRGGAMAEDSDHAGSKTEENTRPIDMLNKDGRSTVVGGLALNGLKVGGSVSLRKTRMFFVAGAQEEENEKASDFQASPSQMPKDAQDQTTKRPRDNDFKVDWGAIVKDIPGSLKELGRFLEEEWNKTKERVKNIKITIKNKKDNLKKAITRKRYPSTDPFDALVWKVIGRFSNFLLKGEEYVFPEKNEGKVSTVNARKAWDDARRALMKAELDLSRTGGSALRLAQAEIGGDIDLRECEGLRGADFGNCEIGGDLAFASKSSGRARSSPGRAGFIKCPERSVDVRGVVVLSGARIGGDAFLVFDPVKGPIIKAEMAKVEGRLDIYPQIGANSYQWSAIRQAAAGGDTDADEDQREGFWLDWCNHREEPPKVQINPDSPRPETTQRICGRCNLVIDQSDDDLSWFIDLRNARATIFTHPPAAWPDPGALSLDGFVYERTSALGPLAPLDAMSSLAGRLERSRLRYVWNRIPLQRAVAIALGGVAVTAVVAGLTRLTWGMIPEQQRLISPVETLLLSAMLLIFAGVFVLRFLPPGLRLSRTLPFVRPHAKMTPRALEYLERQRLSENRVRFMTAAYHALDTYSRAAKALREAGRYVSANLVEWERLRQRTRMLSWRHHGPVKLVMLLVDGFAGYGFALSRAILLTIVLVLLTAIGARNAAVDGALVYRYETDARTAPASGEPTVQCGAYQVGGLSGARLADSPQCPGLLYATDVLLPFVDLGEADRWVTRIPHETAIRLDRPGDPPQALIRGFLLGWPSIVSLIGALLTAIIGLAAVARVESAFARVEE